MCATLCLLWGVYGRAPQFFGRFFWGGLLSHTLPPPPPLYRFWQARRGAASRAPAKASGKFELTEEQKQEIREAFDLFDTDGSGEFGWFSRFLFVWGCRHNHTRGV